MIMMKKVSTLAFIFSFLLYTSRGEFSQEKLKDILDFQDDLTKILLDGSLHFPPNIEEFVWFEVVTIKKILFN